jgi:hypothetical protein
MLALHGLMATSCRQLKTLRSKCCSAASEGPLLLARGPLLLARGPFKLLLAEVSDSVHRFGQNQIEASHRVTAGCQYFAGLDTDTHSATALYMR